MSTNKLILLLACLTTLVQPVSFYELLEVDLDFTSEILKENYFRKVEELRSNSTNTNNSTLVDNLGLAYETLSDPLSRKVYDIYGEKGVDSNRLHCKK